MDAVPLPALNHYTKWVSDISMIRYAFQGLLLNFFKGNPQTPTMDGYITLTGLTTPATVGENIMVLAAIFGIFMVISFLCLKYLYKERR